MDNDKKNNKNPIDILVHLKFDNKLIREFTNTAKSRAFNATLDFKTNRRRRKEYTADQLGKLFIEEPIRNYLASRISSVKPLNLDLVEEEQKLKPNEDLSFVHYLHLSYSIKSMLTELSLLESSMLSGYMSLMYIINDISNDEEKRAIQRYYISTIINTYAHNFMRYSAYNIYLEMLSKAVNLKGLEYACLYGCKTFHEHLEYIVQVINDLWGHDFINIELPRKEEMLEQAIYSDILQDLKELPNLPPVLIISKITELSTQFALKLHIKAYVTK